MNDLQRDRTVPPATLMTDADWVRGDMLKRGKRGQSLREVINRQALPFSGYLLRAGRRAVDT